jgi:hypothetical protein
MAETFNGVASVQEDPGLDVDVGVGRRAEDPDRDIGSDDVVRVDERGTPEREVFDLLRERRTADLPHVDGDREVRDRVRDREVDDLEVHHVERLDVEDAGQLDLAVRSLVNLLK